MTRVLINLCKDWLKKNKRWIEYHDEINYRDESISDYGFVYEYIDRLPTHLKELIILKYINENTYGEIADLLEVPVGTVKSRLNKALGLLRLEMEKDDE